MDDPGVCGSSTSLASGEVMRNWGSNRTGLGISLEKSGVRRATGVKQESPIVRRCQQPRTISTTTVAQALVMLLLARKRSRKNPIGRTDNNHRVSDTWSACSSDGKREMRVGKRGGEQLGGWSLLCFVIIGLGHLPLIGPDGRACRGWAFTFVSAGMMAICF